ncbi:MAG TPA: transglycosylase SLT domain-containing protein [Bosea sp. (in: a-proteobacteria)]
MVDITDVIRGSFAKYGLDPNVGLRIANIESRMNPRAKNPVSSAGGLFQFIDSTAKGYGLADRYDPTQASEAAARLTNDNRNLLKQKLGRDPTPGELYLAHQQGGGGALKILQNPDAPAASLVGTKAVIQNGGNQGMLARDFASLWQAKMDGTKPPVFGGQVAPSVPQTPEGAQIAAAGPIVAPTAAETPDLASAFTSALSQFTANQQQNAQQQPQMAPQMLQKPQMATKKPNLANILAGTSSPLLVGRPVA